MYINFYINIYKLFNTLKNMEEVGLSNQPSFSNTGSSAENMGEVLNIDKELEELLKKQSAKVRVIGVGGGGGNTISRMREIGIKGCELVAANTKPDWVTLPEGKDPDSLDYGDFEEIKE